MGRGGNNSRLLLPLAPVADQAWRNTLIAALAGLVAQWEDAERAAEARMTAGDAGARLRRMLAGTQADEMTRFSYRIAAGRVHRLLLDLPEDMDAARAACLEERNTLEHLGHTDPARDLSVVIESICGPADVAA